MWNNATNTEHKPFGERIYLDSSGNKVFQETVFLEDYTPPATIYLERCIFCQEPAGFRAPDGTITWTTFCRSSLNREHADTTPMIGDVISQCHYVLKLTSRNKGSIRLTNKDLCSYWSYKPP
jgi:hypothetical protein